MNEVFDIKRFGKLVQYEVVNYMPRFFKSLLIFASIIFATWMLSLTMDSDIWEEIRAGLIQFLFTLAVTLAPFIVYKDINNRKKGYMYAMIPASTLEKLLSMIVLCVVVVQLLSYAVLEATDMLLWLLSQAGVGSFVQLEIYNPFVDSLGTITLENGDVGEMGLPLLDSFLSTEVPIFYAMMFNAIFRKNKVVKTILFNMALAFVTVVLTVAVFDTDFVGDVWEMLCNCFDSEEGFIRFWLVFWRIATLLFGFLYLAITYFRIKKVNY